MELIAHELCEYYLFVYFIFIVPILIFSSQNLGYLNIIILTVVFKSKVIYMSKYKPSLERQICGLNLL